MKFWILLLALVLPSSAVAQVQEGRLAGLIRVWGNAKHFHPSLAYQTSIDWDAALVTAVPKVIAARNDAEYAAAVREMLDGLNDPLTSVATNPTSYVDAPFGFEVTKDSLLVVTVGSYYNLYSGEVQAKLAEVVNAVPRVKALVVDLRTSQPADPFARMAVVNSLAELQRHLTRDTLQLPAGRRRIYYGYDDGSPFSSGQYRRGFTTSNGSRLVPASAARDLHTVFLVNGNSALPTAAIPLQQSRRARIVFEGGAANQALGEATSIRLGNGVVARVRQSEEVLPNGVLAAFRADTIVSAEGLSVALQMARGFTPSRAVRITVPATPLIRNDRSYPEMVYPSIGYRVLALARAWNAIEYFFPYKHLLDEPWDSTLTTMLPEFLSARDASEYAIAVAGVAVRISDSHAYVAGKPYTDHLVSTGYTPVRVRIVEGRPIVTRIFDSTAARIAGVEVGDEILSVDGERADARLARYRTYLSASTSADKDNRAALSFLNGAPSSHVRIDVTGPRGPRTITLPREFADFRTLYHRERTGPIIRMLPDSIGYVDLDRLEFHMVDSMFIQLANARAIVFDMRGYPKGVWHAIAPRLATRAVPVARFDTPMQGHRSPGDASESFLQMLEPAGIPYAGKTVMLIDERSVSQSEYTGMFFRAANQTRFVGSPSAGANGEATAVTLPGGMSVGFTGQSVRWPDGSELQRKGLQPDVLVKPTIAGIRAGRDEVLEAAVRLLSEN